MSLTGYAPPVDQLLTYGDGSTSAEQWPNYPQELGLKPEHIPDLIRMATDSELGSVDSQQLEIWAPLHAWRALGQLQAEAAIEPLATLLVQDDDWIREELPEVYKLIGPSALPTLTAYLADASYDFFARLAAKNSIEKIGMAYPEVRDQCVAALTNELESLTKNDSEFNGFLVGSLIRLKAVESAPIIERAFAAQQIEPTIVGDWEEVQVALELKPREELAQEVEFHINLADPAYQTAKQPTASGFSRNPTQGQSHSRKNKSKQKMAKTSRRQNRTSKRYK